MKKTLVSLAAVAALTTGAMAADKGIDIVTTGQAVVYYNTAAKSGGSGANKSQDLFGTSTTAGEMDNTRGNIGIQLNLDADLKNGFTFGSTINYLGTLGLEKNLVNSTMQNTNLATGAVHTNNNVGSTNVADDIYLAQLFVAKKMGNTTLKLGRQELPKSLSPFAFSEGWNVFKNTFDAALVVNTDIPDTTVVGAYVAGGNKNGFGANMSNFNNLAVNQHPVLGTGGLTVSGTAYMLTAQNKSIPMTTITATYYDMAKVVGLTRGKDGANVIWGDVLVAGKDMPLGLKVGVQGGQTSAEDSTVADTAAYGVKIGLAPIKALSLCLAYTSVDGDKNKANIAIQNIGGVKTPLYTQMVANQGFIRQDSDTYMIKAAYNTGDYGKIIAQYAGSDIGDGAQAAQMYLKNGKNEGKDFAEFDLVYKVKAANINWLAAYINQTWDDASGAYDTQDIVRFVARYNF